MTSFFKFDALVYIALVCVVAGFAFCGWLIRHADDNVDIEIRKIRFAAATFAGILMVFVFISTLYFAGGADTPVTVPTTCPCAIPNPGKDIFEKGLTAMFTLAGTIVGYLFGATKSISAGTKT